MDRLLIVNADDFGQTDGITRGVIEAHERGVVTSASLMVRWPAAPAAAAYARQARRMSVGLHVDLGEWICRAGGWEPLYLRVDPGDAAAVEREIRSQVARCRELLGRDPTHLDSHQHVHRKEPVRSILQQVAGEVGVPLRHMTPGVAYCGEFYGQTATGEPRPEWIAPQSFVRLACAIGEGATELACHPGYPGDLDTMYGPERIVEVGTLCDPGLPALLAAEGIRLVSYLELTPA